MKKRIALLAALAAFALPMSAQAHRAWLAPTATVLSGTDAWVGFDAGMSNAVFIPDHAAMNLSGLTTVRTGADGSFTVTWPEPGMYWINASIRTPASGDRLAYSAAYNGAVEVLP